MHILLIVLLIAAMLATLGALVRGVVIFLKTTEEDLKSGAAGPSVSGVRQNKAMRMRIMFQALAVLIVVVLLLASKHGS